MCYDSFSTMCKCLFLSTTTRKKRKVFYFWCLPCFLELGSADNCASVLFAYFLLSFLFFFDFFGGVSSLGSIGNSLEEDGGSLSFALFHLVVFVFFAGGCWSSSSSDDSKRAARFHLAECFWFLLPGCCCVSVMQVDVRYCFKPLMVGFALKWATSFAVPTAFSAYHSGFLIRAFITEKWVPRRNMALPILTISSKNASMS